MQRPPSFPRRLLWCLLPRAVREDALDDLDELYALRAERSGVGAARRWYWLQWPAFLVRLRYAVLRGQLRGEVAGVERKRRTAMSTLLSDLRYAARTLLRNPAFTTIAALTLALGIGANTAIFSVIRTVLLRPLPFPESQRLVQVWETRLDRGWDGSSFTHANFWDVRDMNRTFDALGAITWTTLNLTGFDYPERLSGARVSADFFRVLAVTPVAGRTFARGEDEPAGDSRVAVLAHDLWVNRFASDASVVGSTVVLDGVSHTVIGVLPRGRPWLDAAEVFVPLVRRADADRGSFELSVIGRLKPGVTFESALADLQGIARRLAELYPEPDAGMGITMQPSSTWVADETLRRALWILMGGVGLLLLIACVNLANLLLARATGRTRERAVRAALGAGRARIASLTLSESMLVGLTGAALGLVLAVALIRLLRAFDPGDIPRLADVAVDGWVLGFTIAVALLTGLITGLVPALRMPYRDLVSALREGERSVKGNRRQARLRSILVGAEVAMSLVLLVGAGLLLRSFALVLDADRGFDTDNRLFFEVALPQSYQDDDAARATQFRAEMLERVRALPTVAAAAAINVRPLSGVQVGMGFAAPDRPLAEGQAVPWASWRLITGDYFRTLGVQLFAGRDFTEQDYIGNPWRVIVSRRVAQELWPGESAVGRMMNLWQGQNGSEAEVIGVVPDMLDWGLERGPSFAVYIPFAGAGWNQVQFVVHTTSPPTALVPQLRAMLAEIDPTLPLSRVSTLDEMVGRNVASRRFMMLLLAGFAALALLLALAGVYGVLSYAVATRRSEIGTRIALGASAGSVLRLIMLGGMIPVVIGLVVGSLAAFALSRLMTSMLFGITSADLPTYAGVCAVLALTAAFSCYLPARSALRVDVLAALREE